MKKRILLFLVIFICLDVSGQSRKKDQEVEIINHEVQLGESVRLISKKYLVDPAEIYKRNKFAVDGISQYDFENSCSQKRRTGSATRRNPA
jgi:hypothetical protein